MNKIWRTGFFFLIFSLKNTLSRWCCEVHSVEHWATFHITTDKFEKKMNTFHRDWIIKKRFSIISNDHSIRNAWLHPWVCAFNESDYSAKKVTYLAKLTMAQGIPVGVLNAGNNLSPTSLAFTLKTWGKKSIITGR